ncbi:hypothetical protein, partial [uncultured Mucilaginibacter sp.]|uniref:hypothetical protein n=1 Tax=uncultured Mucilaginibacter sp. TaxID=797541 RepID=UPI0025D03C6A
QQQSDLRSSLNDQLQTLNDALIQEQQLKAKFTAAELTDLQNAITQSQHIPGHAAGGYIGNGVFRGGENGYEFMLNHSTTQAAERLAGGNLNQDSILAVLARGSNSSQSSSKQIVYNDQRHFDSHLSVQDRRAIAKVKYIWPPAPRVRT